MSAQAQSGGGTGSGGKADSGGKAKRKPSAASSPTRNQVTEKMDTSTENEIVEVVESPGVPPSSPPAKEDNSTVRVRPLGDSLANPAESVMPRKPPPPGGPTRTPRKAHLVLRRIEPWSAMKFSFVVSLVCFVVLFVAVAVLYGVLSAVGVFDSVVETVNSLTNPDGNAANAIDASAWFDPVRILGFTALIGAINVVLITALATLGAVIYNIASDVVGGVEVTFSEAE
jgi:hypothetical protein